MDIDPLQLVRPADMYGKYDIDTWKNVFWYKVRVKFNLKPG